MSSERGEVGCFGWCGHFVEGDAVLVERHLVAKPPEVPLFFELNRRLELEKVPVIGHVSVGRVHALELHPPAAGEQSSIQGEGCGRLAVDADAVEDVRPEQAAERMVLGELGRRHRERVREREVDSEKVLIVWLGLGSELRVDRVRGFTGED